MNLFRKSDGPPRPEYLPPQKEVRPAAVSLSVNGKEMTVPSSWTVLRACREAGAYVPTLCHHPSVPPVGRCGVCAVLIESDSGCRTVLSCKTAVEQGMRVSTTSAEAAHQAQRSLQEFMGVRTLESLSSGAPEIEDLLQFVRKESKLSDMREYAIVRHQDKCISCTRCVRACSETQNMNILSINLENPAQPIVFDGNLPLHATQCIACGQCAVVCPTGAVAERDDVPIVMAELSRPAGQRKKMIIMTAPSARTSLGEMMGDAIEDAEIGTTVAACHAAGFDLVFDTTFGADTCATLEAAELIERFRSNGPFPMFTSCCPGWVSLVENKFPHLRHNLSHCKSPMMMLGAMIRHWMSEECKAERSTYYVVALMPCTAKKEEITRPELRGPLGDQDVDVVLTVREMGRLLKARGVVWKSLPGPHSPRYDPPFDVSSGGGALFATSGGVMEAALRVAYTYLSRESLTRENVDMFEECRRIMRSGDWLSTHIPLTPGTRQRREIDIAVVSGSRSIQDFLIDQQLSDPFMAAMLKQPKHFVECMACPGGCIGGGGQPQSLDDLALERRRRVVHRIDAASDAVTPSVAQYDYVRATFKDLTSDLAKRLLTYEPITIGRPPSKLRKGLPRLNQSASASTGSKSRSASDASANSSCTESFVGKIAIIYGSQSGSTAAYAKHVYEVLEKMHPADYVSIHSMNRFPFGQLGTVDTLLVLTSTWDSGRGLMPHNAIEFYEKLVAVKHENFHNLLLATKFSVCGFGSTRYTHFCGFGTQLHEALVTLGGYPFVKEHRVDVDRPDKGKKIFNKWFNLVQQFLRKPEVPPPKYLVVPAISSSAATGSKALATPPGFFSVTVTSVKEYKEGHSHNHCAPAAATKHHYIEFNTGKIYVETQPNEDILVMPLNSKSEAEHVVNSVFPGMLNTCISLVPLKGAPAAELPPHMTVRQLFEQFVDLTHKPAKWFVEVLEMLCHDAGRESPVCPSFLDAREYVAWAQDKTYASVLKMYKSVLPPMEILISMLPIIAPRCYTPIHFEPPRPSTLGICVRHIDGGHASNWLANLSAPAHCSPHASTRIETQATQRRETR
uniref:Fe-only hydrogenase 5 n=1 Tax=Mastigamoeba balamuthi TaxID=108607 RepID=A0A0B4R3B5_MASBA|nr:Fe-only hydrogenase 5 [Mastigamoeba balamuthi]